MARVMVVDDDPYILILVEKILKKEGHEVMEAKNGEECLGMLEHDKPDIILLDIMMPGKDGWEICKKIKKDAKTKDVPVIMFTVRVSEDSVAKSFEYAKADHQLGKPFKINDLISVVDRFTKSS